MLKHKAGWTLRRDPTTEQATWTSPLGHRYAVDHHDYRGVAAFDDHEPQPEAFTGIDEPVIRNDPPDTRARIPVAEIGGEPPF